MASHDPLVVGDNYKASSSVNYCIHCLHCLFRIGSRLNWLHWYSGVYTASLRLTLLRLLTVQQTSTRGEGCARDRRQRYWSRWLVAALSVTAFFQSRLHNCGTVCLPHWLHSHHC